MSLGSLFYTAPCGGAGSPTQSPEWVSFDVWPNPDALMPRNFTDVLISEVRSRSSRARPDRLGAPGINILSEFRAGNAHSPQGAHFKQKTRKDLVNELRARLFGRPLAEDAQRDTPDAHAIVTTNFVQEAAPPALPAHALQPVPAHLRLLLMATVDTARLMEEGLHAAQPTMAWVNEPQHANVVSRMVVWQEFLA